MFVWNIPYIFPEIPFFSWFFFPQIIRIKSSKPAGTYWNFIAIRLKTRSWALFVQKIYFFAAIRIKRHCLNKPGTRRRNIGIYSIEIIPHGENQKPASLKVGMLSQLQKIHTRPIWSYKKRETWSINRCTLFPSFSGFFHQGRGPITVHCNTLLSAK